MASESSLSSANKVKGSLLQREWVTQEDYETSIRSDTGYPHPGKDAFTLKVLQWNILADGTL